MGDPPRGHRPGHCAAYAPGGRCLLTAGNMLSVLTEDGELGVAKALAVDEHGVHVRLYAQRFPSRPSGQDLRSLTIEPFIGARKGMPLSIGHLPLSHASFSKWEPEIIGDMQVAESELEDYRLWQGSQGGYF